MIGLGKGSLGLILWATCIATLAGGFREAYDAARLHDPTYRAARQELVANEHGVAMARASLLPSVSLSISDARVNGSRTADDLFGQPVTSPLGYRSPQQSLSVRAPLFNLEISRKHRQAELQRDLAAAVFLVRSHDLLDRLTLAYLQRLLALDNRLVAVAQLAAGQSRGQAATRRLELGEGTRTDMVLAQAEIATAQVLLSDADNQIAIANLALQQITGLPQPYLDAWAPNPAVPVSDDGATLQQWLGRAEAGNPALAARRGALDAARAAVSRAEAGHYPRLDLVANASSSRSESVSTINQSLHQRAVGLQFNLPLYSGGFVVAAVAQAMAEQEKAQAELDAERLSVQAEVSRLHIALRSAPRRLEALSGVRDSIALALEAATRGVVGGVRVQADVEQARQRLAEAQRDLLKARYEAVINRFRLHARAGMPPEELAGLLDGLAALAARTQPP